MANKPNHAINEALDVDTVGDASAPNVTSSLNQTINRNKEILNKGLKASEDELKQLANIQNNINLANQKKRELINMHYQNYINDTEYQNHIIASHNSSIQYAMQHGIQFWKSYDNSNIFYRVNEFNEQKKLNAEKDLYSLLNVHIKIYDSIEEVKLYNNTLMIIDSYLSIVKNEIFDPNNDIEWVVHNNLRYKNTFQYTTFLRKRFLPTRIQQLEQQLQFQYYQAPQYNIPQLWDYTPAVQQEVLLLFPIDSVRNLYIPYPYQTPQVQLQNLNKQLGGQNSIIRDFINQLSKDNHQYYYIMDWLANFFQTLNKSNTALVLIGNDETTNILINKIIKPIFAYKKEYFAVVNDATLKKSADTIIKDKIFYHIDTDNLSTENIKSSQLSKLVKKLIKPNSSNFVQAIEQNETYIYGETIVTSSNESPYPFLKNSYSRCSVFNITHINSILEKMNMDQLELEESIQNDLDNFSNILAQYQTHEQYFTIAQTDEKNLLSTMKKGVIMTPVLEVQILQFIDAIKNKNIYYFHDLELEDDKNLYKELIKNFKDDAIYQPKLAEYFKIVNKDVIFSENSYFIELLKERECLFNQTTDDKFKLNGQRRYKIFRYKLAKNYQGNCKDTL